MAAQLLPGPHSGLKATLTPGDPLARSMNHYKKGFDPMAAANAGLPAVVDEKPPTIPVRGGKGGIKAHPKYSDMAPGRNDSYGGQNQLYGKEGDNS